MDDTLKWNFPKHIVFEDVSDLMKKFDAKKNNNIIFNLSRTTRAHSSFIGFLIYAKSTVEKNGGTFKLSISPHIKKLFIMLQVFNHFSAILIDSSIKKSA